MRWRLLAVLLTLFVLGYILHPSSLHQARLVMSANPLLRLETGRETEADRLALARAVAARCGLHGTIEITADPHLCWADLLPATGQELALAMEINHTSGLLAILAAEHDGWRIFSYLGPDRLGLPTSLNALSLPSRRYAALVLTELADQMTGAFSRREVCAIYAIDKGWRCLWSKEIDAEAFWNREWEHPPGAGWLQLTGLASWRQVPSKSGLHLVVDFRNALAQAPAQARLPEARSFLIIKERRGRERYTWEPRLSLFILRYARIRVKTQLLRRLGVAYEPLPEYLPTGQTVTVLVDETNAPGALLGQPHMLRILAGDKLGYVPAGAVE